MLISVAAVPLGALYVFIWELLPPGEQAQAMTEYRQLECILHLCSLAYHILADKAKKQKELELP